jgi:hypothetical protein
MLEQNVTQVQNPGIWINCHKVGYDILNCIIASNETWIHHYLKQMFQYVVETIQASAQKVETVMCFDTKGVHVGFVESYYLLIVVYLTTLCQ